MQIRRDLERAQEILPDLLDQPDIWRSVIIESAPPYMERLWTPWEDKRITIHRTYGLEPEERSIYHPHPWRFAVLLLDGAYRMVFGTGPGKEAPTPLGDVVLCPGTSYAIESIDFWHALYPLGDSILSLMVTAPRTDRWSPPNTVPKRPVPPAVCREILAETKAALLLHH